MVKILRYSKQTGVTNKAPNTYSQTRFNPSDFSRASDAIGQVGKQVASTGLDLFQQQESNKAKKAEQLSNQDMKMLDTLEKQKTTMDVFQLKMDRQNSLHEKMDFTFNGTKEKPGLTSNAHDFTVGQDYQTNEENFVNAAAAKKKEILATIKDDVVAQDFSIKFDNKVAALKLNVINGSFKTGLSQRTSAYKAEHKELLYDLEYGNGLDQITAKNRLLGLNGVVGIHEEAFEGGIINITAELAEQYSQGELSFIQAKLMIADDPEGYLALAKGKTHNYPFKNLSLEQRATLDIAAKNKVDALASSAATNTKRMIAENKSNVSEITSSLKDGLMPKNGLQDLGAARLIAESLGDTDTIKEIDDHFNMWATFREARQSNIITLDARISEVQAKIEKSNTTESIESTFYNAAVPQKEKVGGVSNSDVLELKALTITRDKMSSALTKDPLQWADQVNKINLEPMNLNASPEEWSSWVNNRVGDGNQTAAVYNTRRDFLTKAEQEMIMNYWQSDETSIDQKINLIDKFSRFGVDADNVFEEILNKGDGKKESHYFAHIAGLMNSNPDNFQLGELASDFFAGFALKDNTSNKATELFYGTDRAYYKENAQKVLTETLDGSFINADASINETIFDIANMIYLKRAEPKSRTFDKEIYANIIHQLIGGSTKNGVKHGGIAEFNDQATFAPSWMATETFEEEIKKFFHGTDSDIYEDTRKTLLNGQVPIWDNGSETGEFKLNGDVFNRKEGKFQPYLWAVGDGKYIISFNSPWDNQDPQYVGTKNNESGYFILDLNLIKDYLK